MGTFKSIGNLIRSQKRQPDIAIARPDFTVLGYITNYQNLSLSLRLTEQSQITFEVARRYYDKEAGVYQKNACTQHLSRLKLLFLSGIGWFMIDSVREISDGISEKYEVTAFSYEYGLCFRDVEIYSRLSAGEGTIELTLERILNRVCESSNWSVGHLTEDCGAMQRTFAQLIQNNWYDFLKGDVEDSFDVILVFDCMEFKINVYTQEDIQSLDESGLYLSYGNLLKDAEIEQLNDPVSTVLTVTGENGLTITPVNPLCINKIYCFTPYMTSEWMEPSLIQAITKWQNKVAGYESVVKYLSWAVQSMMETRSELEKERLNYAADAEKYHELYNTLPSSTATNAQKMIYLDNYKTYSNLREHRQSWIDLYDDMIYTLQGSGYSPLEGTYRGQNEMKDLTGYLTETVDMLEQDFNGEGSGGFSKLSYHVLNDNPNAPGTWIEYSFVYQEITYTRLQILSKCCSSAAASGFQQMINNEKEIPNLAMLPHICAIDNRCTDRNGQFLDVCPAALERNFTDDQLEILKNYFFESSYENRLYRLSNDNSKGSYYGKINTAEKLYQDAKSKIAEMAKISYSFELSSENFLADKAYKNIADKLQLGSTLNAELFKGSWYSVALVGADIQFESPDNFKMLFANKYKIKSDKATLRELLASRQVSF